MEKNNIKAVILAAGKGTRMKSKYPKVLHKIFGKTLLDRVIDSLDGLKVDESFIIVGHQAQLVQESLEKYSDKKMSCLIQEPQLGTGHAVYQVFNNLINFEGTVVILCGDTPLLTKKTIHKFIEKHISLASDLSILSAELEDPTNYGRIVRGLEGSVMKIVEEKDTDDNQKKITEINTGVYCIEWHKIAPAFLELNTDNAQGEYYLTDIVEWANEKDLNVNAHNLAEKEEIFGINSKADLAEATRMMNQRKLDELFINGVTILDPNNTWISPETDIEADCTILPGCYINGTNYISEGSVIGPNVYIDGLVNIGHNNNITMSKLSQVSTGDNCTIGPFAHLRNEVVLADNVRIGNFVEVKNSTIQSKTNAAHLAYIGDSELGSEVNIGAGTITANYNALTREKSKTIIKDKVKIGSNAVLVAPVTIEESANVGAGSVITKDVPQGALGLTRAKQINFEGYVDKKLKSIEKNCSQLEETRSGR